MNPTIELKKWINQGQTGRALEELQHNAGERSAEWRQLLSLLEARWSTLEKQEMSGTIDYEEANLERNRIHAALLRLIDRPDANDPEIQKIMDDIKNDSSNERQPGNATQISGSSFQIDSRGDVLVGSGNTITKRIVNALGRRQFIAILIMLLTLGSLGYLFGDKMITHQVASFASLSSIQQELARLAAQNAQVSSWDERRREEVNANLTDGMQALIAGNYVSAIQHLQDVTYYAPLASVYKNLAYAYEQMGNLEKASQNRKEAIRIDPDIYPEKSYAELRGKRINLLDKENGGKMMAASDPGMIAFADQDLSLAGNWPPAWAVFRFKEERTALIDQLDFYVPNSSEGPAEIEVFVGHESPTGPFESIGKFKPYNALITDKPFQDYPISPVKAKYIKFQVVDGYWWHELRLWGKLE